MCGAMVIALPKSSISSRMPLWPVSFWPASENSNGGADGDMLLISLAGKPAVNNPQSGGDELISNTTEPHRHPRFRGLASTK